MDHRQTKTVVSRLLHQSILELCKASVPQEQHVQIDGIVCISIGDQEDQIVVKVHEQIGSLQSVGQVSSSQRADQQPDVAGRCDNHVSEYQRKRRNLHSIARAASAKRLRLTESQNRVESSTTNYPGLEKLLKGGGMRLLSTIKTEMPSDDEPAHTDKSCDCSQERRDVDAELKCPENNSSLNKLFFQDLECQQCKLLLPSFDDLQHHNSTEHKSSTCYYCWRSFHSLANYQQHMKTHRKIRRGNETKRDRKETVAKQKCGVCGQTTQTLSCAVEHLHEAHKLEKYFTCVICDEYFPNRPTFITHRRQVHAEVGQFRCKRCDVSFSYVEFKQHEKECSSTDVTDDKMPSYPHHQHANVAKEEADEGQTSSVKNGQQQEIGSETENDIKVDKVDDEVLILDESSGKKASKEEHVTENYVQNCSDDESVSFSQSGSPSNQVQQALAMAGREDPDIPDDGDNYEDDDDGNNSDNDESETSFGDGSDLFGVFDVPSMHALLQVGQDPSGRLERTYHHAATLDGSGPPTCQGPYRCQTCFFVIEDFEEFERHCFEMHCRYVCTYCAQTFANRRNLQRHIRRHVGDMPYVCDECGQRFYRDDNLRRHKLKHMTSVRFVCAYCSTTFDSKNKLISHLIGGHTIDVLKVTDQEVMKHVILKDDPVRSYKPVGTEQTSE